MYVYGFWDFQFRVFPHSTIAFEENKLITIDALVHIKIAFNIRIININLYSKYNL